MSEFIVTVYRYYQYNIPVEAENAKEAIEIVRDFDIEDYDDAWLVDSGFEFEA